MVGLALLNYQSTASMVTTVAIEVYTIVR